MNLTKEDLKTFLKERQSIMPGLFLQECGLNRHYLTQINGSATISTNYTNKITPVMKKYGWKGTNNAK